MMRILPCYLSRMHKIVINQCYCDSFDISRLAKDMLRTRYGIIFDPLYTPRDDPALVQVVEHLGVGAAIYNDDDECGRIFYSLPRIITIPENCVFDIVTNHGYERIVMRNGKKRHGEDLPMHEQPMVKKMNRCDSKEASIQV